MLISFKVSNFKSILEPVIFSMLADKEDLTLSENLVDLVDSKNNIDEKIDLLSVIMGANGSGKSSLIDALKFRHGEQCTLHHQTARSSYRSLFVSSPFGDGRHSQCRRPS